MNRSGCLYASSMRLHAMSKYFRSISTPMNLRPSLAQATPVVPLPMKGSRTMAFGGDAFSTNHLHARIGLGQG